MTTITRDSLKQHTIGLEALIVSNRYPAKTGIALYDLSERLARLVETETGKTVAAYKKKHTIVYEEVKKNAESIGMGDKPGYIDMMYRNHPEKKKLDRELVEFWEGPVINQVPTLSLPDFPSVEGVVEVDASGASWNVDLSLVHEQLVKDGIIRIEQKKTATKKKPL